MRTAPRRCAVPASLAMLFAGALSGCASTTELRAFRSDGCSLFPDGDAREASRWATCCLRPDQAYWRGGTAAQRRRADAELRSCVQERSQRPALATAMYRGVRIGGTPLLPSPFRWGYGWGYGRGYAPLTGDETREVDRQWADYVLRHPQTDCELGSE